MEDGDIDKFTGEKVDGIYQATDKDFSFIEIQVNELDAERNQTIITSIFRTLTGTRHKMRRRQATGIQLTLITAGAASSTIIPDMTATPDMPVSIMTFVKKALTEVINTPAVVEQECQYQKLSCQ